MVHSGATIYLVNMVESYIHAYMAALDPVSKRSLFRGITNTRAGEKLCLSGGCELHPATYMSYLKETGGAGLRIP